MGAIFEGTISTKLIITNGFFTCIYIPILLFTLLTFNQIYEIGKIKAIYISIILIITEIIKYSINQRLSLKADVNRRNCHSLNSIFIILSSILIYFIIPILFGAPVLSQHEETLMFGILLTTLTTGQCLLHLGCKLSIIVLGNLLRFDYGLTMSQFISRNVQFTLLGAWLATVVIPLDSNKAWQAWPIPCCVGALIGNLFGNILSMLLVYTGKNSGKNYDKERCV